MHPAPWASWARRVVCLLDFWALRFRVYGLRFRALGSGLRVRGIGLSVLKGLGFLGAGFYGLGLGVSGF